MLASLHMSVHLVIREIEQKMQNGLLPLEGAANALASGDWQQAVVTQDLLRASLPILRFVDTSGGRSAQNLSDCDSQQVAVTQDPLRASLSLLRSVGTSGGQSTQN